MARRRRILAPRAKERASPEMQLHVAVADYLRHALKPPTIWTTFPAGGGGKARGGKLKAMGLAPGWPDLLVAHYHPSLDFTSVVGLELKAGKGSQTPEQKAIESAFNELHWDYHVCRSVEAVELALAHCHIPLHATVLPARAA